jgi:hypothetical protein
LYGGEGTVQAFQVGSKGGIVVEPPESGGRKDKKSRAFRAKLFEVVDGCFRVGRVMARVFAITILRKVPCVAVSELEQARVSAAHNEDGDIEREIGIYKAPKLLNKLVVVGLFSGR